MIPYDSTSTELLKQLMQSLQFIYLKALKQINKTTQVANGSKITPMTCKSSQLPRNQKESTLKNTQVFWTLEQGRTSPFIIRITYSISYSKNVLRLRFSGHGPAIGGLVEKNRWMCKYPNQMQRTGQILCFLGQRFPGWVLLNLLLCFQMGAELGWFLYTQLHINCVLRLIPPFGNMHFNTCQM